MKAMITIMLMAIVLTSCSKSVLSDVEITDPHLLKVKVKLEQNEHDEREVQVFIRDKNNRPVELMTGKVVVNNHILPFDRAEVNAAGARGYIYYPHYNEQVFKITIYWNSYDAHTFILSRDNGWPGFPTQNCHCSYHHDSDHLYDSYSLRPAPFYNHEISVVYNIMNW